MSAKKSAQKPAAPVKPKDPDSIKVTEGQGGITKDMTHSQIYANLSTRGYLTAQTARAYAGFPKDGLDVTDMVAELSKAGNEVVSGNLGRMERMLTSQAITLDNIFANIAERAHRQEYLKNMETYLRLAMKAQAQCRATIEAIALLKNPAPYIRQANIAAGNQQVNNHAPGRDNSEQYAQARPHAEGSSFVPNKLLETDHAQRLDIGAQAAAGRVDQELEAVGAVHRA